MQSEEEKLPSSQQRSRMRVWSRKHFSEITFGALGILHPVNFVNPVLHCETLGYLATALDNLQISVCDETQGFTSMLLRFGIDFWDSVTNVPI
jgi:hypothetical protein